MQPLVTERLWVRVGLLGAMSLALVASVRPQPPPPAPTHGVVEVKKVRLTVRSSPAGALVETPMDGKVGRTPFVLDVEPNVTFDIKLRLDGYSSAVRSMNLVGDADLFVSLDPLDPHTKSPAAHARAKKVRKASSSGCNCCPNGECICLLNPCF